MDFWRFCVIFLICEYQIFGRVCEIFVNLGSGAAAWAFSGHAVTAILRGLVGVFWGAVYPYTPRHCKAAQRPYLGPCKEHKKAPLFSGAGLFWFTCCALLSDNRRFRRGDAQRLFRRCGRAFCLRRKRVLHQSA